MSHLFMVNAHDEIPQAIRLCQILSRHYESKPLLYLDGREATVEEWKALLSCTDGIIRCQNEPSKCKGIINALNALFAYALSYKTVRVASFLHADHVPTDRRTWQMFLRRFEGGQRHMTFCPMLPGHMAPSFCTLHFWPEKAAKLFPILIDPEIEQGSPMWYNEMMTMRHWDKVCPTWREEAMPVSLLTMPYTGQYAKEGKITAVKQIHMPGYVYDVRDYSPDSSVVHSDDPMFWDNYSNIARF